MSNRMAEELELAMGRATAPRVKIRAQKTLPSWLIGALAECEESALVKIPPAALFAKGGRGQ